ncbi:HD domain-containing protein [Paenibacillus thermotolerans]|uniref:HD domain-containing protein n=1 Tax=Paenibacillus thermotolerans TaxID=3027807 RepID=UPI002368E293|nr:MULTISPECIES: HD domain-containing protein [unclassified Paenibacillus]
MNVWPEEKVFKDPVHKYIYVQDAVIWDLINTREFQRLRRIRQLGTSFFTFHGAEHSRFSHSLGVYELTRKIISQFERNRYEDWPLEEKRLCLCAALLHDVGHGPFSHSLEAVFGEHHEQWSCQIILGDTEVNSVLRSVSPDFPELVCSVIRKTYPNEIVVSMISSQLDADRMDYLLRDAYFTGVSYGMFDLDRILRVIRPVQGKLVVKESGMHAVEDYLMSRYQMYWQVYFHSVTRSSDIVLRNIFARAKSLWDSGYKFQFLPPALHKLFEGTLDLEHYMMLDESVVQAAFTLWKSEKDPAISDLCTRFLERKLFKYSVLDTAAKERLERLRDSVREAGFDPEYYLQVDLPSDKSYDIYRGGNAPGNIPILLLCEGGALAEISTRSDIVRSISGTQSGKPQVYYPEEWVAELARKDSTLFSWLKGEA